MKAKLPTEDLSKTHTYFFPPAILVETVKAFKIRAMNKKGAMCTCWVPKSKLKWEDKRVKSYLDPVGSDPNGESIKKYYVPDFFVK